MDNCEDGDPETCELFSTTTTITTTIATTTTTTLPRFNPCEGIQNGKFLKQ